MQSICHKVNKLSCPTIQSNNLEYAILARASLLTAAKPRPSRFENQVSLSRWLNHASFYLESRPSSYTKQGVLIYKTTLTIFSRAITEIEKTPSDLPFEEVPEPESLDEELESLLEVLEILHPFTLWNWDWNNRLAQCTNELKVDIPPHHFSVQNVRLGIQHQKLWRPEWLDEHKVGSNGWLRRTISFQE